MESQYTITTARQEHVTALSEIELSAAVLLRGHAPESVLREFTPERQLREAQQVGRLWVALAGETPVGFALVEMLAHDLPHLQEIDVAPQHGRRGLGTALVRAVCDWAARSGFRELTLTTFRLVPWNMPFYARMGFEEILPDELRSEIRSVLNDEADRGLDPAARVAMIYRVRR
ncbi:MAG: GNAT family N-acetyltransferase [Acidobacteriota bacterium]